tara:strand:- start:54 stop:656 length:603 start_codon:yes stop_codon:yes gene_type:complete
MIKTLSKHISRGNSKLPKTTGIFNITPGLYCSALKKGLCQAYNKKGNCICYAIQAELQYPPVLPYRIRQSVLWDKLKPRDFVNAILFLNKKNRIKINIIRLNESGDFRKQADIFKADLIAKGLNKHNIPVYCYTARKDLNFSKLKYLIVNGSNFRKPGIKGIFKMIHKDQAIPTNYKICPGNCRGCIRCLKGFNTVCIAH